MPRCPYPSVRRSDPTCEASGTMFRWQGASILLWTRGSSGRVSESESSYVRPVRINRRKRLTRRNQNGTRGGSRNHGVRDGIHSPRRVTDGAHPRTLESFLIDRVSPMRPTLVVSEPRGTGTAQGVKDAGGSERQAVTAWIGPRERAYPTRKGADFRLVFLGRESRARPHPGGG